VGLSRGRRNGAQRRGTYLRRHLVWPWPRHRHVTPSDGGRDRLGGAQVGPARAVGAVEAALDHNLTPLGGAAQRRCDQPHNVVVDGRAAGDLRRAGGQEVPPRGIRRRAA